ncbi:hypothetical protein IWW52_003617 [Coemansia sp. RSA 2704]|nr:hypothetical protein IWW52_003617 [Coemansia sp. RSA 2704]
MRPLTYDTLATNSLVAQPGSGLSSALSHSPPHHQQTQMLHGYGAPTAKNARRWSTQLPATAATGGASYQAFDQSAAHQPLTHSVLALPTAAPQKPANNGLRAAAAALPPTASAYVTSSANNPSQASHMHDAHGLRSQLPKSETATPPSVLESDMAAAGFSGMYSKYAPKKSALKAQSQSPPVIHPQIRSSALANSQPAPPAPSVHVHAHSYPMPRPIQMSATSLLTQPCGRHNHGYGHHSHAHHSHHHHHHHHTHHAHAHHSHGHSHKVHISSSQKPWKIQPTSHSLPALLSLPKITHRPLANFQSRPLNAGVSFTPPKKHVRFAN